MWVRGIILLIARRVVSDLFQIMASFKCNSQLKEMDSLPIPFLGQSLLKTVMPPLAFNSLSEDWVPATRQKLFIQVEPQHSPLYEDLRTGEFIKLYSWKWFDNLCSPTSWVHTTHRHIMRHMHVVGRQTSVRFHLKCRILRFYTLSALCRKTNVSSFSMCKDWVQF